MSRTRGHEPTRMCIACRARRPAQELIRLAVSKGEVLVSDAKYKMPGRGCYVCPEEICIDRALKKSRLERALRKECLVIPSRDAVMRGFRQKRRSDDYVDR
ncbi:MAG: YlxR family protein [Desulfomonilaceae bacterium]